VNAPHSLRAAAHSLEHGALSAMAKISSLLALLVTVLVCLLPAAPAQAQRARVFVASYGSDANPCTFGSPCKTFQNAVNVVAQGGEVTAIDSAGFGPIAISHAVTITSPNGVEAGIAAPASGGSAITINAGAGDNIVLNGLTLDGDNVASTNGITFSTGGTLTILNSAIRNFGNNGIFFQSGDVAQLSVANTLFVNNGGVGIGIAGEFSGGTVCVLDHVVMENNALVGLSVGSFGQPVKVTVSDSVIANNPADGIDASGESPTVVRIMVRTSTIANNGTGLSATNNGAAIRVTRSTITGNGTAWSTTTGGVVTSYGDNNIDDNTAANTEPPTPFAYR
jgi:hypothetical protein